MIQKMPTQKKEDSGIDIEKVSKHAKAGIFGIVVGVAIGWFAKIAFDEGKADEFLKSININRDRKDK